VTELLLALLVSWSLALPASVRPSEDTLRPWAEATAAHCGQDQKRCVFLAALAFEESGFRPGVLSGDCNRKAWRDEHPATWCDGGEAWGPWQLHYGPWLRGADPRGASPDEQARIAASLPEGAWARKTRRLAHVMEAAWERSLATKR
jgi:hypothetical protein